MAGFENNVSDTIISGTAEADNITNYDDNVTISTADGNDSICSYHGKNVSINAGAGNDSIWNGDYHDGGDNGTIFAGAGNDFVRNWSNNSFVDGGSGDDRIQNILDNSTIVGGTGNDSIFTEYDTTVTAGTGDDTVRFNTAGDDDETLIFNYAEGDGNDVIEIENGAFARGKMEILINLTAGILSSSSISSDGRNALLKIGTGSIHLKYLHDERITVKDATGKVTVIKEGSGASISDTEIDDTVNSKLITLTEGDDNYSNSLEGAIIQAEGGNDYISNYQGNNVSINGGTGDDSVYTTWMSDNTSINGGKGNDSIYLDASSKNIVVQYNLGDEFDTVFGLTSDDTLSIKDSFYSTMKSGDDIIVTVEGGSITLKNIYATADSLNINDETVELERKNIELTGDNNSIDAYRDSILVNGSDGNDEIQNFGGSDVTMNGNNGDDYIWESWNGYNSSISGGFGNDTLHSYNDNATINGDDGDDYIRSGWSGSNNYVVGGKGNDSIEIYSINTMIEYTEGDGNDTIEGFRADSTLKIGDGTGTYSKETVDNDIIVTVGEGTITLVGAASLENINIAGEEITKEDLLLITLTENNDTYSNSVEGATIQALGGNDTIYNGLTEYSTITFGSPTVVSYGNSSVSIDSGDGDDYINNEGSYSTVYGGAGKDTIYNGRTAANVTYPGESNVTISGGDDGDYIYNTGDTVSIDGGAGNDTIYGSSAEDVTLDGGDSDDFINVDGENILIRGGKGKDSVNLNIYGWSYIYEYADGDGDDTISSYASAINITKGTVSSSLVNGDDLILNIGKGSITITDGANKNIPVVYGDYGDYWRDKRVENYTQNAIISGGDNSDSVRNHASNVTINAGNGRDTILNENWNGSSWNAPTPDKVLMNGENGDDVIQNDDGSRVTINGGEGNDDISNAGNKSYISSGNGNDTITNYVRGIFSVNDDNMGEEKSFSGSESTIEQFYLLKRCY